MWYFEQNFAGIMALMTEFDLGTASSVRIGRGNSQIGIQVLERSRYTLLLNIEHRFVSEQHYVSDLMLKVRVYLDAALAEVVAYQGIHHLQPRYRYPNALMLQTDEKRQVNLLLHDWLNHWKRFRLLTESQICD